MAEQISLTLLVPDMTWMGFGSDMDEAGISLLQQDVLNNINLPDSNSLRSDMDGVQFKM